MSDPQQTTLDGTDPQDARADYGKGDRHQAIPLFTTPAQMPGQTWMDDGQAAEWGPEVFIPYPQDANAVPNPNQEGR